MTASHSVRDYLSRVVRRPWPWILRYLGALLPAMVIALLLMVPLRGWFRLPVAIEALETRSLDLLFDSMQAAAPDSAGDGLLWIAGLVLVPLVWIVLRFVWLWLEGGVLTTYVVDMPLTVRGFSRTCFRWLGSFLLIGIFVTAVGAVILGCSVVAVAWLNIQWQKMVIVGLVLLAGVIAFGELMRVSAVVWDDRHVVRAFLRTFSVLRRRFLPLLALIVGALVLHGALLLGRRTLSSTIPLSWWAATLIVQQGLQLAITGLALARRAGEIGMAVQVRDAGLGAVESLNH